MENFIFQLGTINKKLLLPLIYIIIYICINIFWNYTEYNEFIFYLEGFGFSVGQMITYLIGNACKYHNVTRKISRNKTKNYFKNYSILFLIDSFYMISNLFSLYYEIDEEKSRQLYINDGLEIIFLTLITYFILKYKYYIHHIISISIFVILTIIIDCVLENFTHTNTAITINSILIVLVNSLIYSYFKYLISVQYYYYMDVLFILGIINLIIHFISIGIVLLIQNQNGENTLINLCKEYYDESRIGYMILRFLFGLVFIGFLVGILEFLIMNELTPNYVTIGYALGKIPTTIINTEGINRWIILIISIFQIIILLFYLEIFEYNFCSLNENTIRNISEREQRQRNDSKERNMSKDIVIKGYDMTEGLKIQEREMEEKEEEEECED